VDPTSCDSATGAVVKGPAFEERIVNITDRGNRTKDYPVLLTDPGAEQIYHAIALLLSERDSLMKEGYRQSMAQRRRSTTAAEGPHLQVICLVSLSSFNHEWRGVIKLARGNCLRPKR
jgi:hypothetical protein